MLDGLVLIKRFLTLLTCKSFVTDFEMLRLEMLFQVCRVSHVLFRSPQCQSFCCGEVVEVSS